jgi:aquaglyceroporin related protein
MTKGSYSTKSYKKTVLEGSGSTTIQKYNENRHGEEGLLQSDSSFHEGDYEEISEWKRFIIKNPTFREYLAEFLGTCFLYTLGNGVGVQVTLSENKAGNYTHINICWGIAVMFGVYISGGISGGHLNPAVTVALATVRDFPTHKVPYFLASQFLGALTGCLIVYVVYFQALNDFESKLEDSEKNPNFSRSFRTASLFTSFPASHESNMGAFLTNTVCTMLLLIGVSAIGDQKNQALPWQLQPIAVGTLVVGIGMAFGLNSGYQMNPGGDLAGRLFTWLFGWGNQAFTANRGYFWIPFVSPFVGAMIGCWIYDTIVSMHHPPSLKRHRRHASTDHRSSLTSFAEEDDGKEEGKKEWESFL